MSNTYIQPLRIPSGWTVDYNTMPEIELSQDTLSQFQGSSLIMLYNNHANRLIDVSWRPEMDINGSFQLEVYNRLEVFNEKLNAFVPEVDWENPYLEFETKNKSALIEKLEILLLSLPPFKDPRILLKRGVVDPISEPLRIQLNKQGLTEQLFSEILQNGNAQIQSIVVDNATVTTEMLNQLVANGKNKGVRNKAQQKLSAMNRNKTK